MKLSVLICSLPNRLKSFSVIEELTKQANGKDVEIIYLGDNKKWSVGEKRNKLISLASGKYVTFVDDDDRVSENYIDEILKATNSDNDCITFKAWVSLNNAPGKECFYSKNFRNHNTVVGYYRQPNHLMVWKKSIIKNFKNINIGEDNHFGQEMLETNYTEYPIDKILYYYDFNQKTTEAQSRK